MALLGWQSRLLLELIDPAGSKLSVLVFEATDRDERRLRTRLNCATLAEFAAPLTSIRSRMAIVVVYRPPLGIHRDDATLKTLLDLLEREQSESV